MGANQSGKEPVATTPQGTPRDVSESATPNDFVKNATSDATKGGDQTNVIASRQQATEPPRATPPMMPHMMNRAQRSGSPSQRVNPRSIPNGGVIPPTPTSQSKGTGSVGNGARPFKIKK